MLSKKTKLDKELLEKLKNKYSIAPHYFEQLSGSKQSIISFCINNNILNIENLREITYETYCLDIIGFDQIHTHSLPYTLTNIDLLTKYNAIPLRFEQSILYLGINDPYDFSSLTAYQFNMGINTQAILMSIQDIDKLKGIIKEKLTTDDLNNLINIFPIHKFPDEENIKENNFIIEYVEKIIYQAINKNASDIHFEPYKLCYRIRFRQDGELIEIANLSPNHANQINSRLKILGNLDIAERRLPQDGRFSLLIDKNNFDFRISSCPTLFGEKIVLRILNHSATQLEVEQLGYEIEQKNLFLNALAKKHGLILVTGPTGSGKTITLYTALNLLNINNLNISTIEDPIEIYLDGINQVQINPKINLSFASALRCFLRQDPDVMMVGEIRDLETAEIAIKAAQTGHLVISTLHTNNAVETLNRLKNMGIPLYNIATTINMIIAQRLIKILCKYCKLREDLPINILRQEEFPSDYLTNDPIIYTHSPTGCENCNQGYSGRIGIYEILSISSAMQKIILNNGSSFDIQAQASKENILSLRQAGIRKVINGITSLSEINRVTDTQ